MKVMSIFLALAMSSSPAPSSNYYSWFAPEISLEIQELVINGEYRQHLDYNGDGQLTIADAVLVEKRYYNNCKYGNEITLDSEVIYAIAAENYIDDVIYYEIDRVNNVLCRQYELTVDQITEAEIYIEFESYSECITVELNPFKEIISVKEAL